MVYCGKPSRGCQMCRTRRIKCDETKPTCNQCAKSRRQCPGYKDEFDLVFRNETKATERRAQKANRKALAQKGKDIDSPTSGSDKSISPTFKKEIDSPTVVIPGLNVPVEQMASCHFVANYVLLPRQGSTRGFMEYLLPLLKVEQGNHHLQHAFNACALASLGNRPNAAGTGLSDKALGHYTKALAETHIALKDPDQSKSDATLASVLMLGLFENMTARQMGMFAWGSHIEGAIQLVKARGRKQLRTKTGLLLFIAVRTQMIIHTLSTGTAPIMGVEWWLSDAVKDESAAQCQRLNIKTAELRAEVTRLMSTVARSPENIDIMLDMIRRAQTVDQEFVNWMRNTPDYFQYTTVAWEDNVPNGDYAKAEVFPGRVDVYQDFWIASVWNMARVSRLILASVIVRCAAWVCSPVDYRTTPEYATAARTCVDTISDIIASVPYHLGWHLKRPELLERANISGFACGLEESQKGLPGYFLTWPLACLHGQDYTTDAQRAWVVGRLKFIGDELGVKYAHILSQMQVRIPSMLIRRDGLMAQPYPQAHNFEKLLSARFAPPSAGYSMNPLQQREAMQKEFVEKNKAELLAKATGTAGQAGQWVAQNWLTVRPGAQ
ncbi:white-opaque regulator 2 [Colletotrichum liriopes]|uniref:White-opaque regulator 2 n=1 Tax=Colletotrichum liriopes TaxID=708192 RepID=A0AA37LMQ1_9PEZI|nr:white-opaque regulator 2 [Colletotrichum liriopes]